MSDQLTEKVMLIDVCRDVFWCVCGCSRWRSVWTWSNRCRTAPTRSWRPACRVSRGPTWRRDPSSRRLWVSASITRLTPRRSWSAYESHLLISFLSAARKNSRSRSWLSVWWRVPRCWGTTLYWGKSSLIIDRAIGFFSVLITLVCILIASDCLLTFTANRKMLKLCGETEEKLAQELIQFEFQIERDVVEPLYVLAEVTYGTN